MLNIRRHVFWFLLCSFSAISITSYGQKIIDGQVLDKQTELAIPGVTVKLLKHNQATQTTIQGYFELTVDSALRDTLSFTSIGYKPQKLAVKAGERQLSITLEPTLTNLNQVNIKGAKAKDQVLGHFLIADLKEVRSRVYSHITFPEFRREGVAKLFEAPQANTLLVNIMLGRRQYTSAYGPPSSTEGKIARFYVRLYDIDPETQSPGKILLSKEVVLLDNSIKITLDLTKEKLIIPNKKFFVAIEWIRTPINEVVWQLGFPDKLSGKYGDAHLRDLTHYDIVYQPCLVGYISESNEPLTPRWVMYGGKWVFEKKVNNFEIALAATIRY